MGLNQGEVHRIGGVRGMSNVKRKFKRINKGNIKSPWVKSSREPEGLVTFIYYDGKGAFTFMEDVAVSDDDLSELDKEIIEAFKRLPWKNIDDLLKIADFVIDQGLVVLEEKMKED